MPFACSICEQESTRICAYCTKDACENHLCERCGYCSDCCQCEVRLDEPAHGHTEAPLDHDAAAPESQRSEEMPPGIEPQPSDDPWAPAEAQSTTPEESGTPLDTPDA